MKQGAKTKLGVLIFAVGFSGILTLLLTDIPLPEELRESISKQFTPFQFKLLSLINPTILLLLMTVIGVRTYDKVMLKLPVFEKYAWGLKSKIAYKNILKYGISGGLIGGINILLFDLLSDYLNLDIPENTEKFTPDLLNRFLYGGITEEILMRFGVMSGIIWLLYRMNNKIIATWLYGLGIILSAFLFGLGHLPLAQALTGSLSGALLIYILVGNGIGGIIFGWLYWKKGLETAMIAHITAHIIFISAAYIQT